MDFKKKIKSHKLPLREPSLLFCFTFQVVLDAISGRNTFLKNFYIPPYLQLIQIEKNKTLTNHEITIHYFGLILVFHIIRCQP